MKIVFTTKDTLSFVSEHFSMYTFSMPLADGTRTFGLGERGGNFFLQDNTVYTLHTNDHNLPDFTLSGGRKHVFCRQGFLPYIFSRIYTQQESPSNYTSVNL